jgi:monofunctional glycosyltransferase
MVIQAVSTERPRKRTKRRVKPSLTTRIILFLVCFAALFLLSVVAFRFINPPFTPLMVAEKLRGYTLQREWVPLKDISPNLPLAVIASEDGRFCLHWGVDWGAVRDAIREGDGLADFRGASTIPMQVAKNLYLWNSRSYLRKLIEMPLAYLLSFVWPKQRMMEVYLNVAQWGPGIFGAEAASRHYFHKSAADLTRREALLLAVSLPNPRVRNPARPSGRLLAIAGAVNARMPIIAHRASCLLPTR